MTMKTPLAWLNLWHNKSRTAVAISGVAFSVLLVFMQLGFLGSVAKTATMNYEEMDFDIVIRSPEYLQFIDMRTIPQQRLRQATMVEDVQSVRPFYSSVQNYRHPTTGQTRAILCLAIHPGEVVFHDPEIREQAALLAQPNTLLIDGLTRHEFGLVAGWQSAQGEDASSFEPEIGDLRMKPVGLYRQGTGMASKGAVLMGEETFKRMLPGLYDGKVSIGLIKLDPGANVGKVVEQLRAELRRSSDTEKKSDVEVLTRNEALAVEHRRWVDRTSIGTIFKTGVAMALIVGIAIVYQVLSSDIDDLMAQYATLKAMGYSNTYLATIVLQQSALLAIFGFLPGAVVSWGLYLVIASVAYLPIEMPITRLGLVLVLTLVMCALSGLAALQKVQSADPADLF